MNFTIEHDRNDNGPAGTIIMLNGTSSSGKSTILTHLQGLLTDAKTPAWHDGPWLNAGIDKFIFMLPGSYLNRPLWDDVLGKADHAGEQGHRLFSGMHHALAALAHQGNHLLVDHVLVEPRWADECARLFADLPAYLIGIHCPLEVLERRERDRKDRTLGQARLQFDRVHQHGVYDLEIDSSTAPADACAATIATFLATSTGPRAFRQLQARGLAHDAAARG